MAAIDDKKPVGLLAIDIERTGKYTERGIDAKYHDMTFAVGFADAPINASKEDDIHTYEVVHHLDYNTTTRVDLSSKRFEGKPDGYALAIFEGIWNKMGYESRCFNEFWSKNIDALIEMHSSKDNRHISNGNLFDFVSSINWHIERVFERYSQVIIVMDTVHFDATHINNLLYMKGHEPLTHSRNGIDYVCSMECDSYAKGALGLPIMAEWSVFSKKYDELIDPVLPMKAVHDHCPSNDAKSHLLKALKTNRYLEIKSANTDNESPKRTRTD